MGSKEEDHKYIYCLIELDKKENFGPLGIGGKGDELYTVFYKNIAALISDSPLTEYSPSRENYLSHAKAIERVMKQFTVLPVRFGTVVGSEQEITGMIEREYDRFYPLFRKVEGKNELGLKAFFKKENIYEIILERNDKIKKLKDRIAKMPAKESYHYKIKIGEMVVNALEEERERCKGEILKTISPLVVEVKDNDTYGDNMVLNSAFLVDKENEENLDQKIKKLDETWGEHIIFKYTGPFPPFNFINLTIKI